MGIITVALAVETAAETPAGLAGVAATLGLNGKLFLAQLINFGLLVLILWRLLYKPLVQFMEERSKRIVEGLDNAKRYDEKLKELESERQNVLVKADREAQKILAVADDEAKRIGAEAKIAIDRTAAETIARANREIEQAKKEMISDIRRQAADLVVLAAEKVIHERLDEPTDRRLIDQALKEVG
ncbi:ATP synthase F0 subunit B [Candidatus Uhrbacteria bacterium RIFCSPLOWO2_12_FULL_46_10]|uniref:ATP synthase subunit b n=1 Tax=Candidatus Uhrbacteria bacterium RIFCSPLOWO2_01_FULL_47_25 TaxID=1802402 RepID=A0A1F7UV76_9BACT|nr:MAG: ATP synthase subunit b [Parcubacteria group bacterium GW2011_GWA2_46_9]OGL59089.1 MAG: ATP synthase F0 subunit B [Candidatus Uhrbacteria bacterium RIFCSPHIGHO2_01_FULL_46_23]OGL68755.1 MAG: ATP synthase F0 subunit B [Candidatus Uhrbacteria bacterium RIFCSPHIGHO2_02_FULL_47_29]OGL74781.1 MAG: ATP synthase F0 subunit B [Candidatus Uhrbacteria bacterium RIFCSPHIGHO2_12_FULL_46_13]OGL82193.1 MAG: ATP synthase F0 subunit B [Candidatus Uhrbacteria bacterium RIFCSPLOWO2_01_FULL_47_25]OGL85702